MSLNISQVNGALSIPGQVIPTGNSSNTIAVTSFVTSAVRDLSTNINSFLSTFTTTTTANIANGVSGELLYQSNPNTTAKLAVASANNSVLTFNTTTNAPQWSSTLTGINTS